MNILKTKADLSAYLNSQRGQIKTIGLVPTMGALHKGHLSLIDIARTNCDIVVCSIFVNPTQFNNPVDLEKYPRPIDEDIEKLHEVCDALFMPEVNEMYKLGEAWSIDLGAMEHVLEGSFRPGHYQGVTQIVNKLFDVVKPDMAFFGQKDFQQFKVIEKMVQVLDLPVKLMMCPIVREADGLAMSSRNRHLSATENEYASALSKTLFDVKENFENKAIVDLKAGAIAALSNSPGIELEYFEICDSADLQPTDNNDSEGIIALVAAWVGSTRLIDNIILK